MKKIFYLLFSCNQWKECSSMRIQGVADDVEKFCVMVGTKLKSGDMLYKCNSPKESLRAFIQDYKSSEIKWELLEYGYVETFENYAISDKKFTEDFPKAKYVYRMLKDNVTNN